MFTALIVFWSQNAYLYYDEYLIITCKLLKYMYYLNFFLSNRHCNFRQLYTIVCIIERNFSVKLMQSCFLAIDVETKGRAVYKLIFGMYNQMQSTWSIKKCIT